MSKFYRAVQARMNKGEAVVLATVVETSGPTPRKAGARMAVFFDGTSVGTIGGGSVEAAAVEISVGLHEKGGAILQKFLLNNKEAATLGMVCGGEQSVLFVFFESSDKNLTFVKELENIARRREKIFLVTRLDGEGPMYDGATFYLFDSKVETIYGSPDSRCQEFVQSKQLNLLTGSVETFAGSTYVMEVEDCRSRMYIFGAGHVARPTVSIASLVGFQTVVLDDRSEFANSDLFPEADKIVVLPGFDDPFAGLDIDEQSYVVIVTRGHSHDQVVLSQAIKSDAAYIGMIGSSRKVKHCFDSLKETGVGDLDLGRVHAPIGLEIGSETPEEIAVSIVAELIQVRDRLRKGDAR